MTIRPDGHSPTVQSGPDLIILFQNIISLIQLENDCEEEMLNQAQNCYSLLKDFLKGKWKGKPPSLQLTTPEQIESVHF